MVTARPWPEKGDVVDLPSGVVTAATTAGLRWSRRCVALLAASRHGRFAARPSLFQLQPVRNGRAAGIP